MQSGIFSDNNKSLVENINHVINESKPTQEDEPSEISLINEEQTAQELTFTEVIQGIGHEVERQFNNIFESTYNWITRLLPPLPTSTLIDQLKAFKIQLENNLGLTTNEVLRILVIHRRIVAELLHLNPAVFLENPELCITLSVIEKLADSYLKNNLPTNQTPTDTNLNLNSIQRVESMDEEKTVSDNSKTSPSLR